MTGWPVSFAEKRFWSSAVSVPFLIQSVRESGSPLSKTLSISLLVAVLTNGCASSRGYAGSEYMWKGLSESRSPMRVPPPRLEKTVWPSWASRAAAVQ